MIKLNLQFFGGRGSTGQSYQTSIYGMSQIGTAFLKASHAPIGTKLKVHYLFGGDSNYVIKERHGGGAKRQLVPESGGRGRAITTPSSIRNILGKPNAITIYEPVVKGKRSSGGSN